MFDSGIFLLLEVLFHAFEALLHLTEVTDHQIKIHILDVAQRIDVADVRNRRIIERPHHMRQGIDISQMTNVGRLL